MRASRVVNIALAATAVFGTSAYSAAGDSDFRTSSTTATSPVPCKPKSQPDADTAQAAIDRVIDEIQHNYLVSDRATREKLCEAAGPLPPADGKTDPHSALYAALEQMFDSLDPHSRFDGPAATKDNQNWFSNSYVSARVLPGDIAYIKLGRFGENAGDDVKEAFQKMAQENNAPLKGLILDLRDDPGGLEKQAVEVAGDFMPASRRILLQKDSHGNISSLFSSGEDVTQGLPMVVLINGGTASSSEIVANAFRDYHRAILVGVNSFGKGIAQTVIQLPDTVKINGKDVQSLLRGSEIIYTTHYLLTPKEKYSIQLRGIEPDVEVSGDQDPKFREKGLPNSLPPPDGVTEPVVSTEVCSVEPGIKIFDRDSNLLDNDELCAMKKLGVSPKQGQVSLKKSAVNLASTAPQ